MSQKLYARTYLKNNKKRVATLIISLTLCVALNYLTSFLLGVSTETVKPICYDITRRMQYISYMDMGELVPDDAEYESYDEAIAMYNQELEKQGQKIEKDCDKVEKVFTAQSIDASLNALFATWYFEGALMESNEVQEYLDLYDAELIEGRLPQNDGEVVLDSVTMKNNSYKIGDPVDYYTLYTIVGVVESDLNLICGTPHPDDTSSKRMFIFSEGIEDLKAEMAEIGIKLDDSYVYWTDYVTQTEDFQVNMVDAIEGSTEIVYAGIVILMCIALSVIYITFLRDRHSEWCLYASIGYSRKSIYLSIMRELLFTFILSLVIGAGITALAVWLIDILYLVPHGLGCNYFNGEAIRDVLLDFLVFFAILQIPVRYALYRIKTIDALGDDLY
ncbi:MAG: ABC transporter permease [Ruminococcus sp.]|nr:ABC transporter permease [Ruminococcus sp.]